MNRSHKPHKILLILLSCLAFTGIMFFLILSKATSPISAWPEKNVANKPTAAPIKTPMPTESPVPTETPTTIKGENNMNPEFSISPISEEVFLRMEGLSWKEDCTLSKDDLRYLIVTYYGFDETVHTGEIIVNRKIAEDVRSIFQELYEARYPIEKIKLIDEYQADDNASMGDNNSSAFNFRFIDGTTRLSNHAEGLAIDINPLYNPYVRTFNGTEKVLPHEGEAYADRGEDFPYKIDENDICFKIFMKYGFEWGGSWKSSKDYQHFQKLVSD